MTVTKTIVTATLHNSFIGFFIVQASLSIGHRLPCGLVAGLFREDAQVAEQTNVAAKEVRFFGDMKGEIRTCDIGRIFPEVTQCMMPPLATFTVLPVKVVCPALDAQVEKVLANLMSLQEHLAKGNCHLPSEEPANKARDAVAMVTWPVAIEVPT